MAFPVLRSFRLSAQHSTTSVNSVYEIHHLWTSIYSGSIGSYHLAAVRSVDMMSLQATTVVKGERTISNTITVTVSIRPTFVFQMKRQAWHLKGLFDTAVRVRPGLK